MSQSVRQRTIATKEMLRRSRHRSLSQRCARTNVTPFQAGLAALTIVQGAFDARDSPRLQAFLSQILH